MIRPIAVALAMALAACQTPPISIPIATATPVRSLAVVVSGPAGAPVDGANVCATTLAGRQERCGETGGSGTARLAVRPGAYSVDVTPRSGSRLGSGHGWADVVDADATTVIALEPHSTIRGTVRDEAGAPVTAAQVCAFPPSSAGPTCAKTAAGAYAIDIRSDVYKVAVDGPPGGRLISQWATGRLSSGEADIVDVRAGDAAGIDVTLVKGVNLSGVIRGPSGPVEDAQVCVRTLAAPLPWECERTKKNGSYLALLEPGRYYMWVVPPDNVRLVAEWYDGVLEGVDTTAITVDRDRSIDMTLATGPQIKGNVRTTDGQPVAAALVCVDTPFPTGRICRPTGSDGSYTVTTRPQNYIVQVIPPQSLDLISEYWLRKRAWNQADWVALGNGDRVLDLTVRKGVRVTGVIRDTRGIPLEAATVNIVDAEGELVGAESDQSGTYALIVPPGSYQIEVFAPFRGERGDLLSQPRRDIVVSGFTRYDFVLEDVKV